MERLAEFDFVKAYMIASMAAFVWFGISFPVSGKRSARAGALMLVVGLWVYVGALAATSIWAVSSGEWARFSAVMGVDVLFEMGVFVAIWQFIMYFMASRYMSDKRNEELGRA